MSDYLRKLAEASMAEARKTATQPLDEEAKKLRIKSLDEMTEYKEYLAKMESVINQSSGSSGPLPFNYRDAEEFWRATYGVSSIESVEATVKSLVKEAVRNSVEYVKNDPVLLKDKSDAFLLSFETEIGRELEIIERLAVLRIFKAGYMSAFTLAESLPKK